MKLLNSTRQIYTSETSEFSSVPAGASPGSRPVGRNAGWNPPGGIIATSSTATTVAPGVPFGAKRAPGRKVDPNKRVRNNVLNSKCYMIMSIIMGTTFPQSVYPLSVISSQIHLMM